MTIMKTIEYNGELYAKQEVSSYEAQVGDIIVPEPSPMLIFADITGNKEYEVVQVESNGDPRFVDDSGDLNGIHLDALKEGVRNDGEDSVGNAFFRKVAN